MKPDGNARYGRTLIALDVYTGAEVPLLKPVAVRDRQQFVAALGELPRIAEALLLTVVAHGCVARPGRFAKSCVEHLQSRSRASHNNCVDFAQVLRDFDWSSLECKVIVIHIAQCYGAQRDGHLKRASH